MTKREQFGQKFIYFILILWFSTEVLFNSTLEKIIFWKKDDLNAFMAYAVLILLLLQIVFFQVYQIKELILIAAVTFPIILATLNSGNNRMISTWIFIVAAKYIDFDKVTKISYYVELVMTFLVFYLFMSGIIYEYTLYRGSVLRHSLGFTHPNQLGIRIFLLVVCRCYIRRKNFNFFDCAIIIASAYFVYRVANSKTSYYALVILAVLMIFHTIMRKLGGNFDKWSNVLIVVAIISNIASLFFSLNDIRKIALINKFDRIMSRRFSQCYRTFKYYGIKLLGQDIQLIVNRPGVGKHYHFWLDNAYMSIMLRYGPVVFIMFSVLYVCTMILLKKMQQYVLVEILCLYAVYGIMENNFYSMSQNLFLLLLSYPIYKHQIQTQAGGFFRRIRITW